MVLPIVVGVDGSEPSLRAVDWAADEAALRGAPLRLVYAPLWERYEGGSLAEDLGKPSEQVTAEDIVRTAAQRAHLRRPDIVVSTDVFAVRAWRCPAHETTDHPLLAGEPARLHEQHAVEVLDKALKDPPAAVDLHRRTVEGPARRVLLDASHEADLLVVGARRNPGHLGLQLGRVAHAVLHHSACAVAVVPEQA
ncbi:universal stress protein [Streptomyces sp. NPDC020951]|uniref:universal stress protein n=1 Tax=Streptomyces sp. NPDC020951 TaxID=3365104 RepID=UPI0037946713